MQDFAYYKSLYPAACKQMQLCVEAVCDALEYEGSPIYDEYPDRIFLEKLTRRALVKWQKVYPAGTEWTDTLPAYMKAADKPAYRAKHEAELVIYEAAKSTLLAIQGDGKLPSLKSLQAEQQRLADEQQRLKDDRAKLKKEARLIDTMKANVDDFLSPSMAKEQEKSRSGELE